MYTRISSNTGYSLVPRLLCGGGGREPGTHCSRMRQVPLVTCILLRYTLKLRSISAYLLKAALHRYTPCGIHTSDFEVKNNIALTVTVCIASFEVIGELQRASVTCQSVKLEWTNAWTIPASKEPSTFLAPSSLSTHSVVSGRQLLYERSRCPR